MLNVLPKKKSGYGHEFETRFANEPIVSIIDLAHQFLHILHYNLAFMMDAQCQPKRKANRDGHKQNISA